MKKTQIVVMATLLAFLVCAQNAWGLTKNRSAVSPYFQTDPDSTYTFMGVSHPSLTSAASQIGLTVATIGTTTAASSTFTVAAGETYRIFIAATNHSTINSVTVSSSEVIFLSMTSGSSESNAVSFVTVDVAPQTRQTTGSGLGNAAGSVNGEGYAGLNYLSIWGAVVIPGTTSGFAMEFVGDMHNSASVATSLNAEEQAQRPNSGRGIN